VICYRSLRPGWAGPLVHSERGAGPGALAAAVADLLSEPPVVEGRGDAGSAVVDVLVCTHGRRDSCCGGRGMDLVTRLSLSPFLTSHPGVRLWRTSHTGGHRFAPTSTLLPSGTLWAWADEALLRAAALGEGEAGEWVDRYRGCATLGSPALQAVERAVLAQVGWGLIGSLRRASDLGDGVVRLETEGGDAWEAAVREGRRVPQPDCRTSPELAAKQSTEWVVEGLRQVVPA
jgi:Sucrase/ferredoxin-like